MSKVALLDDVGELTGERFRTMSVLGGSSLPPVDGTGLGKPLKLLALFFA